MIRVNSLVLELTALKKVFGAEVQQLSVQH